MSDIYCKINNAINGAYKSYSAIVRQVVSVLKIHYMSKLKADRRNLRMIRIGPLFIDKQTDRPGTYPLVYSGGFRGGGQGTLAPAPSEKKPRFSSEAIKDYLCHA